MGFADIDKARIRYHLEYPNVARATTSIGGVVRNSDVEYVLEAMMENILPQAQPLILRTLDILDGIELQMVEALARLQASKADVVTLNPQEHGALQGQYAYWQGRLSKQLDIVVNPNAPNSNVRGLNVRRR